MTGVLELAKRNGFELTDTGGGIEQLLRLTEDEG